MFRLALAAALLAALVLAACGTGGRAGVPTRDAGEEGVTAVTSLGIFADFVREVGGDRVSVTQLLPAGADPHTFEPRPSDLQVLSEADVVFINGLGLEGTLEDTIYANVAEGERVVRLSGIPALAKVVTEDPHWWLDVTQAVEYVSRVRDALIEADPGDASGYRARAESYAGRLRDLDGEILADMESIPREQRKLVTFHKSFNSFAARYGLRVVGFVVSSPGADPSPKDIADLTRAIGNQRVPAVFVERGFNSSLLEQIAEDTGVQVCTLYSDALDERVPTYVEMMRFNADELVRCLGG